MSFQRFMDFQRHGKWIAERRERPFGLLDGFYCSECGYWHAGISTEHPYCSNCGALMDGKENLVGISEWVPMSSGVLPEEEGCVWITDVDEGLFEAEFFLDISINKEPQFYRFDEFECDYELVSRNDIKAWRYQLVPKPYHEE